MLLRMLAATVVLVAGLAFAPPSTACGGGYFWPPKPVAHTAPPLPLEGCIARDMQTGLVREIAIQGGGVRWYVRGDPRPRFEDIRLGQSEIALLRSAADGQNLKVYLNERVSRRRPRPLWVTLGPAILGLSVLLFLVVRLRRRQAVAVRVLTRNVERREAFALVYATLMVAAVVWGTWPNQRAVTLEQLRTGVDLGLIHEVTFAPDSVTFRHVASSTAFVVPEAASDELKLAVRRAVIHAPDPEQPRATLHHIRVRDESGIAGLVTRSVPWIAALAFWALWVHLIRRQSWW